MRLAALTHALAFRRLTDGEVLRWLHLLDCDYATLKIKGDKLKHRTMAGSLSIAALLPSCPIFRDAAPRDHPLPFMFQSKD